MMNLLLLYGGRSGEHEVSLRSAASVLRNLKPFVKVLLAGIDPDGVWFLQPDETAAAAKTSSDPLRIVADEARLISVVPGRGFAVKGELLPVDLVFPVLHGSFGEDGTVQGLVECSGLPCVGAGVLGSALSMDKEKTKLIWNEAGLPIVPYTVCSKEDYAKGEAEFKRILKAVEALGFPIFIKPACVGSSVGISKVKTREGLKPAIEEAFRYDVKILLEQAIDAREIECSVLGNHDPRAFTPGEVVSSHEFYDYEAKYIDPDGAKIIIPAKLNAKVTEKIKSLAVCAYTAAGVEGMARVDFFVDRESDEIYVNEINTIPGFTNISMFPMMCEHDGLKYPDLLESLLRLGMERWALRKNLTYRYQ